MHFFPPNNEILEWKKKNRVLEKDSRVEEKLVGLDFYGQYRETDGMA